MFDALRLTFEMALRAHQPARSDGGFLPEEVLDAQTPGVRGRPQLVARGREASVSLLPRPDRFVDLGQPPGRVGKGLQVIGSQIGWIGGCELVVRLRPRLAPSGISTPFDVGGPLGHAFLSRWWCAA